MRWKRIPAAVLLGVGLAGFVGCGSSDNLAVVKGNVTYDGKPIEKGSITFSPSKGNGSTQGGEILNGQYSVRASVGANKVQITGTKVTGKKKLYNTADSPSMDTVSELLPKKYNVASELTFTVQSGENAKDFTLEK